MPKLWPREQLLAYWNAFVNIRNLWTFIKGYCPIEGTREEAK